MTKQAMTESQALTDTKMAALDARIKAATERVAQAEAAYKATHASHGKLKASGTTAAEAADLERTLRVTLQDRLEAFGKVIAETQADKAISHEAFEDGVVRAMTALVVEYEAAVSLGLARTRR